MTNQRGMTLVELMIALTIGLMLLAGAASMFITNKRIYQDIGDLGALQENGRFALELMMKDLRMAGYPGCDNDLELVNNRLNDISGLPSPNNTDMLEFTSGIEGSESGSNWAPSNNSTDIVDTYGDGAQQDMVSGTDAITVRYLAPIVIGGTATTVNGAGVTAASDDVPVSSTQSLAAGDLIAVSDCDAADIFQITGLASSKIKHASASASALPAGPNNSTGNISKFPVGADVNRYVVRRYFVGLDQKGTDGGGNPIYAPALFWETPDTFGDPQVLVEGVENMQILYGKDTDDDNIANSYVTATDAALGNTAANWERVVNVKISMLMRTPEVNGNLENDTNTYNLLGSVVGPYNDKRRRRIFKTTVQVRNQYQGNDK